MNNKPSLLFIHGFMGSITDFYEIAEKLQNKFEIDYLEIPHHDLECNYNNALEYFDSINLKYDYIVAYSMGGRIALWAAYLNKLHFKKMILESTSFGIENTNKRSIRLKADLSLFDNIKNFNDFLMDWYSNPMWFNILEHPNYKEILNKKNDISNYKRSLELFSVGIQPYLLPFAKQIKDKLFYIYGEHDQKYKNIAIDSNIKSKEMKCCGHNTHFQDPTSFVNVILEQFDC